MSKRKDNSQRLVELETENKQLKLENETLKGEIAELRETIDKLRQSQTADSSELQRELIQQLSETRKQLLTVQDRLTVAEQVTAATQRRELIQEGLYENLRRIGLYENIPATPEYESVPDNVYEALEFDSTLWNPSTPNSSYQRTQVV